MEAIQFDFTQMAQIVVSVIFGLSAFTGALVLLVKNSKTLGTWWQDIRMASCPNHAMTCNNLGGLIVFFCAFSKYRGHIDPFERAWLDSVMKDYEETEQNHGVKAVYDEAIQLPNAPGHKRRCTDKEI